MKKIVTFGEIMMRLNPEGYLLFTQADKFEVSYAGSEANVAVSLANFGLNSEFITKLPVNDIGRCVINELRKYGVETKNIVRGGPRLGIYFVEKGASQRPSKVIYDRAGSSIALAKKSDFDWNTIFTDADWFHFSGITPALGGDLPEICIEACQIAKSKGLTISCDLNYRKKLWDQNEAERVMNRLMPFVDVCIGNEEDAKNVFGITAENTDVQSGKLNYDGYVSVARKLTDRFGFKKVAITLRSSISADDNNWAGMLYSNGEPYFSPTYKIHIVDRVGGGDSFVGGLIYALISDYSDHSAIDFAAAASCLKHSIEHDFNLVSVDEVKDLMKGNVTGRVQR